MNKFRKIHPDFLYLLEFKEQKLIDLFKDLLLGDEIAACVNHDTTNGEKRLVVNGDRLFDDEITTTIIDDDLLESGQSVKSAIHCLS